MGPLGCHAHLNVHIDVLNVQIILLDFIIILLDNGKWHGGRKCLINQEVFITEHNETSTTQSKRLLCNKYNQSTTRSINKSRTAHRTTKMQNKTQSLQWNKHTTTQHQSKVIWRDNGYMEEAVQNNHKYWL